MAVDRAHVHTARKPEDAEARTEHMVAVFEDGEPKLELSRKRGRGRDWIRAHPHNLATGGPNRSQLSLQLHELLLACASSASFKEVDDDLGAPQVGQRRSVPSAGGNRVGGHRRPDREPTTSDPVTAGSGVSELRDGDKSCYENNNAATNCVRPPVS